MDKYEFIGGSVGIAGSLTGSVSTETIAGKPFYEVGTASAKSIPETIQEIQEIGTSSQSPFLTTTGAAILGSVSYSTEDDEEWIGPIWAKIKKDRIPYSMVEKRAVDIYNVFHKTKLTLNRPAIIAKTSNAFTLFKKIFCKKTGKIDIETIYAVEKILERINDEPGRY